MGLKKQTALGISTCTFGALFLIAYFQLPVEAGKSAAPTGPKQCVFSRSRTPTSSSSLGIVGVPAYVNFPNGGQKCGTYITQVLPGSMGQSMGLRPGRILVTVDGRVAQSPSTIDSILRGRSGSLDYSYIKVMGGVPEIVSSRVSYTESAGAASPSSPAAAAKQGGLINDTTPLGSLESYMFSLINKDRAANGQPAISESSKLASLARSYAEFLLKTGQFSHTADGREPIDRAKAAGIKSGIAENLAYETRGLQLDKDGVTHAQAVFMAEPKDQHNHRWNILWSDAKSVGVGMARDKNRLMMVQEFSDTIP